MPAIFGRFVALVFGAIGATIIISLWTADGFGEPPLFFKIVGSLIASLFVFIGVSGGILGKGMGSAGGPQDVTGTLQQLSKMQQESRRGADRNPETGSSGGGYACTNCGATLQGDAEVSPSGDVKCSYCERWFNIHRSA